MTSPEGISATPISSDMDEWLGFIRHLADVSAAQIKPYYRNSYQVEFKSDMSPVTIADRNAEEAMRELIMREYPDHGILGEEFGHHLPGGRQQIRIRQRIGISRREGHHGCFEYRDVSCRGVLKRAILNKVDGQYFAERGPS